MNNLGGYSQQLDFTSGALGESPLLPNTCAGAVSGPSNPDGQCVKGGRRLSSGACEAYPIFLQSSVPYTTGSVAGHNFQVLQQVKYYTKLNQDALMKAKRASAM